jgi:phenylpropionate dioxygenase-like ring-hydroxylating dioxygenase large terminal subunit
MPFFNNDEEEALVRVGPGTPSGEVFRRYWLPVETSANLGQYVRGGTGPRNPIRVKMLGEDLVLYRDASGKAGLLAEHCSHRGTSLFYGRVEDNCLRCLYHGWAYDQDGNVVETPGEPPDSNFKHTVKHPSYPTYEVGGLIFAYMGPRELEPPFPRFHQLFAENGVRVTGNGAYIEQCNVFQALHDNNMDPWHGEIAHGWFRGRTPVRTMHHGENGAPPTPVKYERTPWGTRMLMIKSTRDPNVFHYHETHTVWPTQRCNQEEAKSMKWAVPIDDYRTRWFTVDFFPFDESGSVPREAVSAMNAKHNIGHVENLPLDWAQQVGAWWNLGHPWRQGNLWEDEVAQQTQGSPERNFMPDWEQWHLGTTDRGLITNRELWREQIDRVKEGMDPIGIVRGAEAEQMIRVTSDNITNLSWEEAQRLMDLDYHGRLTTVLDPPDWLKAKPRGRGRGE